MKQLILIALIAMIFGGCGREQMQVIDTVPCEVTFETRECTEWRGICEGDTVFIHNLCGFDEEPSDWGWGVVTNIKYPDYIQGIKIDSSEFFSVFERQCTPKWMFEKRDSIDTTITFKFKFLPKQKPFVDTSDTRAGGIWNGSGI